MEALLIPLDESRRGKLQVTTESLHDWNSIVMYMGNGYH